MTAGTVPAEDDEAVVAPVSAPDRSARVRLRVRFAKVGKIRWTSHRDLARMWERAFRRVDLPLAYSEGFSPRPRVSFGLALPTGCESVAEFLDVELTSLDGIDLDGLVPLLSDALPVGVDATAIAVLAPGTPSLQESVSSCAWRWMLASGDGTDPLQAEWVRARTDRMMTSDVLEVTRSRKGVEEVEDIRPGILALAVEDAGSDGLWLRAELAAQPRSVRPADVTLAIGPGLEGRHVRRTSQWILRDGARHEPLEAASVRATSAPHARRRAS